LFQGQDVTGSDLLHVDRNILKNLVRQKTEEANHQHQYHPLGVHLAMVTISVPRKQAPLKHHVVFHSD
jgi:ABC-type sulfate transport system permease component